MEDDSAEIEAASFKKFPVEVNSLARVSLTYTSCRHIVLGTLLVRVHVSTGALVIFTYDFWDLLELQIVRVNTAKVCFSVCLQC